MHLSFRFLNSTFVFDILRCTFSIHFVKVTVEPFIFYDGPGGSQSSFNFSQSSFNFHSLVLIFRDPEELPTKVVMLHSVTFS